MNRWKLPQVYFGYSISGVVSQMFGLVGSSTMAHLFGGPGTFASDLYCHGILLLAHNPFYYFVIEIGRFHEAVI